MTMILVYDVYVIRDEEEVLTAALEEEAETEKRHNWAALNDDT